MMRDWIRDNMLKTFSDAQKNLWEYLSSTLPAARASGGLEVWQQAYNKNLDTWEGIIKQTLSLQAAWLEQWEKQKPEILDTPGAVGEFSRQAQDAMESWVRVQTQLCDEMFKMLRVCGEAASEAAEAARGEAMAAAEQQPAKTIKIPIEDTETRPEEEIGAAAAEAKAEEAETTPEPPVPEPAVPPAESVPVTETVPAAAAETSPIPAAASDEDDLEVLSGLGPAIAQKLKAHGIVTYRQLAQLSEDDIKDIEANVLKSSGRFRRFDWVGQAKEHHRQKYGEEL